MGSVLLLAQDGEGIQSWTLTFYERLPRPTLRDLFPLDSLYSSVGFSRLRSGVRWSFRSIAARIVGVNVWPRPGV